MAIAFVGDVHGCARHLLAAALALQVHRGQRLDGVIQVGDLGAHRSVDTLSPVDLDFLRANPAQGDLFDVVAPSPELRNTLTSVRDALPAPGVLFLSGNHEDDDWLSSLHDVDAVTPIDEVGVLNHVASGTVLDIAGARVAFVGGIDAPGFAFDLDDAVLDALSACQPGSIDVLVTHDGPHGLCRSWRGDVQGSTRITALIDRLQPRFHVSGHYHEASGPRRYGATTSYMVGLFVEQVADKWGRRPPNPTQRVAAGSIGLLDQTTWSFEYVDEPWLAEVAGDHPDLGAWLTV